MKNMLAIIVVSVLAGSVSGAITATLILRSGRDHIKTSHLDITDPSGVTRASLGVDQSQFATLQFFSQKSVRQLSLGIVDTRQKDFIDPDLQGSSPEIELDDETGRKSVVLGPTAHGNSRLDFYGIREDWHMGLGYINDGSDFGPPRGVWGMRVSARNFGTALGVFAQPTADRAQFLAPVLDSFGTFSHFEYPNFVSPVMKTNPVITKQFLSYLGKVPR